MSTDPINPAKNKRIECNVCQYLNRPGLLACENCGSLLTINANSRQATRDLVKDGGSLNMVTDEIDDFAHSAPKTSEYQQGMGLNLFIEDIEAPVVISPQQLQSQVVIGRHDPITQQSPPVDLDEYAAYRQGVSRKHSALQIINGALMVSDLGSSNGTFLNDVRLPMRQPRVILDGDTIRVGQVAIVVRFVQVD
jgi:pSer/pThr/pTyr-binding forkhead associated (FHA) protein